MSLQLHENASRTLYDDSYKAAYASMGPDLRPFVTLRQHSGLEDFYFRTMGRMVATDRGAMQMQVPTTDVDHAKVQCTLSNLIASTLTDIFSQDYTNAPQEVPALAKVHAGSIKRQETQKIIDALNYARNNSVLAAEIATGATGLTIDKLLTARAALKKNDIGETPVLLITETQERNLLAGTSSTDNKFTSADFQASSGAVTGNIRQGHFGFNYIIIGSGRDESGLPVDTDRVCFAFVPSAVGLVTALEKREVNYESDKVSWRSTAMLRCGAVVIDVLGVVSILCDE